MGAGKTVEDWDAWTAKMQAEHGNGNGHGKSLAIEAQRLLPTPRSQNGEPRNQNVWERPSSQPQNLENALAHVRSSDVSRPEGGSGEELRDVRDASDSQEVCEWAPGGSECLPEAQALLSELWELEGRGDEGGPTCEGTQAQGPNLPGLRDEQAAARSSRGSEPGEQRSGESDDALRELSPTAALAGGPAESHGRSPEGGGDRAIEWGPYEAAIRRWEIHLGRPAPAPTTLSKKGTPQLSAVFCEWLMGLPAGWVTDVPGMTRNEALKALGNGVVPQQATAAVRFLLNAIEVDR